MPVYGPYSKEVEEEHLRECPLPEGHYRIYTDHTGRWFEDFSPEEYKKAFVPDPNATDPEGMLYYILSEEIKKERRKELEDVLMIGAHKWILALIESRVR